MPWAGTKILLLLLEWQLGPGPELLGSLTFHEALCGLPEGSISQSVPNGEV